ncbi:ATP-dependent Clp protease proteolytic subunit [Pseudotenacibaculum haliotis]|uniref:ATP-dependent Clp protease proteolytic subunit n=1 Tax=Pseudotenacibaculum haliotis TaxID=1862138 RepID=A0ABW5LMV9_9FLAO
MNWNKIISFIDPKKKEEVGRIEATNNKGVAYFKIIGRIWSWSADYDSILRREIDNALSDGIKKAVVYGSSPGGSVFATSEIANLLDQFDDVKIEVGALMASAFTYLTSKFHTTIKTNTQGMIHMPMTSLRGNIKEVKSELKLLENITDDYVKTYSKKTGKSEDDIKALWADGDYWMNATELKKEGFVDAVAGEIEAFTEEDILAIKACGAPTIPKKKKINKNNSQNSNQMDREELIALYGLEANATDADIMEAAKKIKVDALKHRDSEKAAKEKKASEQKTAATELVEAAIKDKKIKADQKEQYQKLAEADYDSTKSVLEAMKSIPKLTDELDPKNNNVDANKEKWTLEDWIEKDPKGYNKMLAEGDERLEVLENDYFKTSN